MERREQLAREAWLLMSDLVLDNARRRQVSEALGMSFGRTRVIRRLARRPMSMGELATAMGIDRPNATPLVDELEARGLALRKADPEDRRLKLVDLTAKGKRLARKAEEILATPPAGLSALSTEDLEAVHQALSRAQSEA